MATVSVNYNFSSFRVKVTPNTVLNDVLSESLNHFKLNDNGCSRNEEEWTLEYNKKPVTLDLPWRFLNMAPGVNLELKKGKFGQTSNQATSVRIKLQVPGHSTVIETIKSSADLRDMLDILSSKHGWSIDLAQAKLQVFSRTIPCGELRGLTLSDVGVKDSVLLRLISKTSEQAAQQLPVDKPDAVGQQDDNKTVITPESDFKRHDLHKVAAFIPPETSITSKLHDEVEDDNDYEMTIEQARSYQKMLSKQTGNLGGPLLSKRLREAKDESKRPVVTECVVRVRFPDLNHIEVAFQPDEDMDTVYGIVSDSVLSRHSSFILSQPHPYIIFPRDKRKLVDDLGFGSKTLLLFESESESPYLKHALLEHATELSEASDVRLDQSDNTKSTDNESLNTQTTSKPSSQGSKIGKVPKWLKLSKK